MIAVLHKLDKRTTLTIDVRISNQFKLRILIAIALFRLAGFVLGCGIKIEDSGKIE